MTLTNGSLREELDASCDFESRWWRWAPHYALDCQHLPSSYKQHQSLQARKTLFPPREIFLRERVRMVKMHLIKNAQQ